MASRSCFQIVEYRPLGCVLGRLFRKYVRVDGGEVDMLWGAVKVGAEEM